MECILMAMSMRTLWSIEQSLLNGGRSTRSGCIPTTTTENATMNLLGFLSLLVNDSGSSWSPMMNQHFMRLTTKKPHGGTNLTSQSH